MIRLKKSTGSQELILGTLVDAADGYTPETALTIANTDIKIWKNGATTAVNKNSGGATHIANGMYYCVLDATDTDTVGPLVVMIPNSGGAAGARPIVVQCEVLEAVMFDSLFGTTGMLANLVALTGSTLLAQRLATQVDTIAVGVTSAGTPCTTTTITVEHALAQLDPAPNQVDQFKDKVIIFTAAGTNTVGVKCVGRRIKTSTATSPYVLTVDDLPVAPAALNAFIIVDANVVRLTSDGYVQSDMASILGSIQAATAFKRMALAASYGTLAAGSTQTVLQINGAMTPALTVADQVKGRVCLIVDESGSQASMKMQGGKINTSTTTSITLETPVTVAPSSGNVIIIL
jgi:hypothetical protein